MVLPISSFCLQCLIAVQRDFSIWFLLCNYQNGLFCLCWIIGRNFSSEKKNSWERNREENQLRRLALFNFEILLSVPNKNDFYSFFLYLYRFPTFSWLSFYKTCVTSTQKWNLCENKIKINPQSTFTKWTDDIRPSNMGFSFYFFSSVPSFWFSIILFIHMYYSWEICQRTGIYG